MTTNASPPPPDDPLDRLPPVDPPSARFIMQLFVIPFIVVLLLVFFLLAVYGLFGRIATGGRDAIEFVQAIRSQNENRRWRAAFELASLIHNEPKLSHDAALRAELSELLSEELRKPPEKFKAEVAQYLALALGSFEIDAGSSPMASADAVTSLRNALDEAHPALVRIAAVESLSRIAARGGQVLDDPELVATLTAASKSSDPDIRQRAAYALGYFGQPEARTALGELVHDEHRDTRYNAAVALARLGDPTALPVLREMLSTADLEAAFATELTDQPDLTRKRLEAIQLEALITLKEDLERGRIDLAQALKPDLEKLAHSAPKAVEIECKNILTKLGIAAN